MPKCRECNATVVFVDDAKGTRQILDPKPPIWEIVEIAGGIQEARRAPRERFMVTHFATCTNPGRFSRRSPKQAQRQAGPER